MKKIISIIFVTLFIVSCGTSTESTKEINLTKEYIETQYIENDRSINLSNTQLKWFINLNKFKTEKEVNNIYISDNNIEVLYISTFDKLWKLDINNNPIRFINDLKLPISIRHLDISNTKIDNLSWLEKYTALKTLNISNLNLDDKDIKILWNFKKLIFIKIDWLVLSDESLNIINWINHRFLLKNSDPFIK